MDYRSLDEPWAEWDDAIDPGDLEVCEVCRMWHPFSEMFTVQDQCVCPDCVDRFDLDCLDAETEKDADDWLVSFEAFLIENADRFDLEVTDASSADDHVD